MEIARFMIDPSGFVRWAVYEPGFGEEFNAILDEYIRAVGVLHPTDYSALNPSQNAG